MLKNKMKKYNKVFGNKYRYVTMYAFKKVKQVPICTKIGSFDPDVKVFN